MLLRIVEMLKKKLGINAIERDWSCGNRLVWFFKIPSSLVIPEGCEKIGDWAFWCCRELEKAVIPKSVKVIKYKAFYDCYNAVVIITKPSIEIETCVFLGCKAVTYVEEKTRN